MKNSKALSREKPFRHEKKMQAELLAHPVGRLSVLLGREDRFASTDSIAAAAHQMTELARDSVGGCRAAVRNASWAAFRDMAKTFGMTAIRERDVILLKTGEGRFASRGNLLFRLI